MRKIAIVPAALACVASLAAPAAALASPGPVLYDSTPAKGVVSVPSLGAEATGFNSIGNEVLLGRAAHVGHVAVTMESWACRTGSWTDGSCATPRGATFNAPITLTLYRASRVVNHQTGEIVPGGKLLSVTKTFRIRYRPSSQSPSETRFVGSDGKLHNGLAQTISFPINHRLPSDVVWAVSYDTNTSGVHPLGRTGPMDSLNVGLSRGVRTGHNRFPDSIFWDTRFAANASGASFVTGVFNLDGPSGDWAGYVPAAQFVG